VHPFDYIIKPVNEDRITEVIAKIVNRLNNFAISRKVNKLTLKNKDETYFIHPKVFFASIFCNEMQRKSVTPQKIFSC